MARAPRQGEDFGMSLQKAPLPDVAPQRAASRFVALFETTVPDRAAAFCAGVYGPNSLQLQSGGGLAMTIKGFDFANLHLGAVRHGAPTLTQVYDQHPHWVFSYLRRGQVERNGVRFMAGDAGMTMPGDTYELRMSADAEVVNLRVAPQDLSATSQALMGTAFVGAPQFSRHAPAGGAASSALLRVMSHLAGTPAYPQQAARHLERSLQDAALIELLLAWPNSHQDRLDQPAALPASTRRARDFIHARIGDLPSVADVAVASGVGVRALTRGFERHLSTSPLQYMLELRLQGVRGDLVGARDGASVTDLALKWGFSHLGQFAARYRQRFGESPRDSLRGMGG
jgi:AraC-like DNA-binding protein